jgi:hypothetical protein
LGWLWTTILLISASWVVRITGVSHQGPAILDFIGQCLQYNVLKARKADFPPFGTQLSGHCTHTSP